MKTIKVKQVFRREVEARLRRVAHAATVFLDGDDFREVAVDPGLGRVCGDAAEDEPFKAGGVGGAEECADVVHAADVVEHDDGRD